MKKVLLLSLVFLSFNAYAFKDGEYHCQSNDGHQESFFRMKTLSLGGEGLPFLEVTRTLHTTPENADPVDVVYTAKGIANAFGSSRGAESLMIGSIQVELKDGIPGCVK